MKRAALAFLLLFSMSVSAYVVLAPSTLNLLQPGDIIVRKGGGPVSYQLMHISKENYSHCGVVVKQDRQWMVIQSLAADNDSEPDGMQIVPIADFVKFTADSALFICRSLDSSKTAQVAQRAFYYLGKKIPFDHRFNLMDDSKFYCSELLIHIFKDVFGEPVFEIRKQHNTYVPLFSTFFDTSRFKMIFQLKAGN